MIFNIKLFVLLTLITTVHASPLIAHRRDSHRTCGYSSTNILAKYPSRHNPSQLLIYKYSEVESDTSRLLPWHHSTILTCHLRRGEVRCTRYYAGGGGSAGSWFPDADTTSIAWNTVTFKEFEYETKSPGFYCVNSTINRADTHPVIFFGQEPSGAGVKTLSVVALVADISFSLLVLYDIWKTYNTAIAHNPPLQIASTAISCLILAKILSVAQGCYFRLGGIDSMTTMTYLFSGLTKGLAISTFVGCLLLLSFELKEKGWDTLLKFFLPLCLPVFLLTGADAVLLTSYDAPRLPMYYAEGYRGWLPLTWILILMTFAGYLYIKRDHAISRGPEKTLILFLSILCVYGIYWVCVVMRLFLSQSKYLDTAPIPPLVMSLRVVEWSIKAVLPAGAVWLLATEGKDNTFGTERQPLNQL